MQLAFYLCGVYMLIFWQEPPTKVARLDDFADLCDPDDAGVRRSELADYVNLKVTKDTDMVEFWKANHLILPKLYRVARQVLCVPASSAASERVFSTAGRMLEKRRTSLSSSSVNSLLFLNSNLRPWTLGHLEFGLMSLDWSLVTANHKHNIY